MIHYGLSLDSVLPENLPETFSSVLAVPAGLMPGGEWPENITASTFRMVNDPADPSFCRMMPEESFRVQMHFLREMAKELRRLNSQQVHLAVISMDTDRIAADPAFAEKASLLASAFVKSSLCPSTIIPPTEPSRQSGLDLKYSSIL